MSKTPAQIAAAYAALKTHRRCEYVGGGRISVMTFGGPSISPVRYIRTTEALAAIAKATGSAA